MIEAESSGIIPFRNTRNKREYLVLKSRTNDWEFPKGSIESDEELQQTALRELEEETAITSLKIIDGFKKDYAYKFENDGEIVHKKVNLFIGHSYEASADLSNEHYDHQWRTFDQAISTLSHNSIKQILKKADQYLDQKGYD
jgi:8-oxo-dGTP pyrophosphatase MutT (NUDIX family)